MTLEVAIRLFVFFFEARDQFRGGHDLAKATYSLAEPQMSFQAFALARSPEASVPKLIFDASDCGRFSGSMPAATIDGFR